MTPGAGSAAEVVAEQLAVGSTGGVVGGAAGAVTVGPDAPMLGGTELRVSSPLTVTDSLRT